MQFTGRLPTSYTRTAKAPKRRFTIGQFFRHKKDKDLWCVIACYRLLEDPHEWIYLLEERKNTEDPTTAFSAACQALSGTPSTLVFQHLMRNCSEISSELAKNGDYAHGDRSHVKNQRLLNEFTPVEVQSPTLGD